MSFWCNYSSLRFWLLLLTLPAWRQRSGIKVLAVFQGADTKSITVQTFFFFLTAWLITKLHPVETKNKGWSRAAFLFFFTFLLTRKLCSKKIAETFAALIFYILFLYFIHPDFLWMMYRKKWNEFFRKLSCCVICSYSKDGNSVLFMEQKLDYLRQEIHDKQITLFRSIGITWKSAAIKDLQIYLLHKNI